MNEHTKQVKIKAYINPQMVNSNLFKAAWNGLNDQVSQPNPNKILINPNFKRPELTLVDNKCRQLTNHVHVNPNFINQQKIKGNGVVFEKNVNKSSAVIEISKSNAKIQTYSINLHNNKTKINVRVLKENSVKSIESSSKISGDNLKNSLYSWHTNDNHKILAKGADKNGLKDCIPISNKSTQNESSSRFKFVKGKKNNQTSLKTVSPLSKKNNAVFTSRTKIVNRRSTSSPSILNKSKFNYLDKRKMLLKRRLQFLRQKSVNASKISSNIKTAASVRSKYKYTNKSLIKTKWNLKPTQCLKYKIDKRTILPNNVKGSVCKNGYKIEKLFPNNKYRIIPWHPTIWRTSFLRSWKRKATDATSHKNIKHYPNRTVVKIGGILYKSSQSKLTRAKGKRKSLTLVQEAPKITGTGNKTIGKGCHVVYVRGEKFMLDRSGKSLKRLSSQGKISNVKKTSVKRIDIGGVTYLPKSNNVLIRTNTHHARYVVNHAKQRSIALLWKLRKRNYMPCMIYSRLGKCARHEKGLCSYTHDQKNIALCKKFLKGECHINNCPLSHDLVQEKMATCHFFLNGCCNNEACPYLHVKVNSKAPVCKDFIQGFCKLGLDCTKRHVNLCPEFDEKQKCSKGDKCLYPHRSKSKKKAKKNQTLDKLKVNLTAVKEKSGQKVRKTKRFLIQDEKDLPIKEGDKIDAHMEVVNQEFIPKRIKLDNLPCFIPLDNSNISS